MRLPGTAYAFQETRDLGWNSRLSILQPRFLTRTPGAILGRMEKTMKIFGKTLALATVTLGLLIAANGNIVEAGDRSKASESVGRHVHVHY